jgi:two-component system, chemotaxis family, sensor kinase Cph1
MTPQISTTSDSFTPPPSPLHDARRSCDWEPIHAPGAIQPHGILLLFDAATGVLSHRAGDCERLLDLAPDDSPKAGDLLGISIDDLIVSCLLNLNDEPVYVGLVRPRDRRPLAMMAHRTGRFVAVELLEAELEGSVASALDMAGAIFTRINACQSLSDACAIAVDQVRAITGFDSVMIYRFQDDGSGSVIAESRIARAAKYLGHRFPASDIPRQARELYRRNLIRMTPDVGYEPAPLVPTPDGAPIDMSHCILRSVAPVHVEYMKNMGLDATMSISLPVEGELWGLIVCHHYSPRLVPVEAQLFCRHVGTSLSAFVLAHERAESARLGAMQTAALDTILEAIRSSEDPERRMRTSCDELKRLIDSGGFVLLGEDGLIAGVGRFPAEEDRLRSLSAFLGEKLRGCQSYATDCLSKEYAEGSAMASEASGLLAIRLQASRPLIALWLRPEQVEEIEWAGDPRKDGGLPGSAHPLAPRLSFATWRETVRGRSRPWAARQIEAVELFCTRVGYAMQRIRLERANAELGEANALLARQATTDPLTGLSNRRLFDDRLRKEWSRARREDRSIALIAIDIDHFKEYNDRFGHPAGDECLKRVAQAIGGICREIDIAARVGGEEFALLLPGIDVEAAAVVAERVRATIEDLGVEHPHPDHKVVTISLGVAATSPARCNDAEALMVAADRALYRAKSSGRNTIAVEREG